MKTKASDNLAGIIAGIPPGTHFCLFYNSARDLTEALVPYFKAGLKENQRCICLVAEPLTIEDIEKALKKSTRKLQSYIEKGQLHIARAAELYTDAFLADPGAASRHWDREYKKSIEQGYTGLRIAANAPPGGSFDSKNLTDYEAAANEIITANRITAACCYPLDDCSALEAINIVSTHRLALVKHNRQWNLIDNSACLPSERKLAETTYLLSTILEKTHIMVAYMDPQFNFITVNNAYAAADNRRPDFFPGKNHFDLYPNADNQKIFRQVVRTGQPHFANAKPFQYAHSPQRGTSYWDWSLIPTKDSAKTVTGLILTLANVTGRKKIEHHHIIATKILESLNKPASRLELIKSVVQNIKDLAGFDAVGIRLREGDDFPYFATTGFSKKFVRAENYLCSYDKLGKPLCDSNGRPFLECMCGNILSGRTDPRLPFFTKSGSFWTNSTTGFLKSPQLDMLGKLRGRCNTAGYESIALIPLRAHQEIVGLLQLNDRRSNCFTLDYIHFFERMAASIGIGLAKRRTEEALAESEQKFRTLVDHLPGAVYRSALHTDCPGCYISDMFEQLFGYPAAAFTGRNTGHYVTIVHPEDRHLLDETLKKAITNKKPFRVEYRIVRPDASVRWVQDYGRVAFDNAGKPRWLDGVLFDVTKRKVTEEALEKAHHNLELQVRERTAKLARSNTLLRQEVNERRRLQTELLAISDNEQRSIGQALHDGLGQQLTGLALTTKTLERKLSVKNLPEADSAARITRLLNEAIDHTRDLVRILNPVELEDQGLVFALNELAAKTERLFNVYCPFYHDGSVTVTDKGIARNLYRIAQEAVTNAVKHGKPTTISISLTAHNDRIALVIRNNGVDFPEVLNKSSGLGLQIMDYRARSINASLDICSAPNGGTVVTCLFTNHQPQNHTELSNENKDRQKPALTGEGKNLRR